MADYEMIAGLLKQKGYFLADSELDASINLIVTCSVKDTTEHKMLYRIDKFTKSGKPLVVAGCLAKADRRLIEQHNPNASLLGPNSIERTVQVVNSALQGHKMVALDDSGLDKTNVPRVRLNNTISIVEIASGCFSECTFCQTKLAKGQLRSYRIGDIKRQISNDINEGCSEIWLTSTDNGCYGLDNGSNLADLINACVSHPSNFKIRVGMMNPMYVPSMIDNLILAYDNPKIFKFLHIPIQSGSNKILRKMKRGNTARSFREIVRKFRTKFPDMTIATDIIVGFPTETEDDFQATIEILRETLPDIVNSSKYSARRGTAAATNMKRVDSKTIKFRTQKLHNIIKEISMARNSRWLGWKGQIIIDEINEQVIQGRNYAYKPVIIESGEFSNAVRNGKYRLGDNLIVQINGYTSHGLRGSIMMGKGNSSI
jgi:MiaB-like tRNA modifying enzyme